MDDQGKFLRDAIARSRGGRLRWRCPAVLRSEVVAYARERQASGDCVVSICRDLGLSQTGLSRWLRSSSGEFRPVRVVESRAEATSGLVLVTPRGYRLEGLTTSLALQLVREL